MTTTVAVVRGSTPADGPALLDDALDQLGAGRLTPGPAVILVALSPPVPVSAPLVEALVDRLHDSQCRPVVVAGALSSFDRDRGHTEVEALARAAALSGITPRGRRYDVTDLRADLATADVPETSVLSGQLVSRLWAQAGTRVVVARNVTDPVDGYALCLQTLTGAAAPIPGADPADVVADLLAHLPPHLAVVDALISSHGPQGSRTFTPLPTATVVAGVDALLVDVAAAALQHTDPAASRLGVAAIRRFGLPLTSAIKGDLTPFPGWRPAHPLLLDAGKRLSTSPTLTRVAALTTSDNGGAPAPDAVIAALRAVLAPVAQNVDDATARAWLAGAQYVAAWAVEQARAWRTVFGKQHVDRLEVPLGFELGDYTEADYRNVASHLAPLDRLLAQTPRGEGGLRWRYLDGSVLFETSRVLQAPFEEFVARVNIAEGISLMADYIGGRAVPVGWDDEGRVELQAERNLYLVQPNYLAFWGGEPIDVCKLELIDYASGRHRLRWRTILSPNGSAEFDDGSMIFAATPDDTTLVTVRGRQRFTLPPMFAAADLDRFPEIKDGLVEDAYRRFFTATFDNLEAFYEGREFRIGRPATGVEGPLVTTALSGLLSMARGWLADKASGGSTSTPSPRAVDGNGFRHFAGSAHADSAANGTPRWQRLVDELKIAVEADRSRATGR